jgi:hypothetical protein
MSVIESGGDAHGGGSGVIADVRSVFGKEAE